MISVPPELLGEGAVVAPVPEAATFVEPPFVTPAEAVPALPRRAAPLADPPAPAVEAATEAEPEPEPEPVRELEPWHELERPEPEPAPRVAPAVELGPESEREVDGAPEPTLTVTPEPPTPTRPRLGIGTFADLRATPTRGAPRAEPAPVADVPPAPEPSEPPVTPAPDRAAAFADVANAVDAVTAPVSNVPSAVFSEDLLPQKLPKRGRRSSRLGAPWARDKKASSVAAPPAAVSAPAPASPPMPPSPAPTRDEVPSAHGSLHFPPGGPALASAGASDPEPEQSPARSAAEGDNRFAFFAAFRAAAERAREEAGIDDRRVGP
jgi:hypothetical protein